MNRHQAEVKVAGKTYQLSGYEDAAYYKQLAQVLDRAIDEVQAQSSQLDAEGSLVAAALSLTDELIKTKDELSRLRLHMEMLLEQGQNPGKAK